MILAVTLLLLQLLLPAAAYSVHSGFNYGAFWGTPDKPKHKGDYTKAFKAAYSLNTSVAFDSARIFTCRQPGKNDAWNEALDAAVDTHTYLLLGFYLSEIKAPKRVPGQTYGLNADMLKNELRALEKALGKYGQGLADLIIGLSVGNEDMEQWYASQVTTGVPEDIIADNIAAVHSAVSGSAFNEAFPNLKKYMADIPIGHTDTAPYAAKVKNVDFVGMNTYPYWSRDPPANAKASYFGSLEGVKKAIPGKEIWLTEVGWPFSDTVSQVSSQGTANKNNLQKYWDEVGCNVFGKNTVFWFELVQDSFTDQPDWGIIDASTDNFVPRIDVSCGIGRKWWATHRRDVPSSTVTEGTIATSSGFTQATSSPSGLPLNDKNIHTGFSYGAFWSEDKPKRYEDFLRQFQLARNLSNVPAPFTSARLYQAAQWGPDTTVPTEAFRAAIETNTTLLIGLWLPIDDELKALDKAFETYGQKLVDLVIGIAVGNEDIYRGSDECTAKEGKPCDMIATPDEVMGNITHVKDWMRSKPWFKLFKVPPPIGHADTARNSVLEIGDFAGANIFPFWHNDTIDQALGSFEESLKGVQDRAGETPVWITETGWPSAGNATAASLANMQKYWSNVGCSLIGKYNTFWFELEKDTHDPGNLDWGLIDVPSQKPKITDLSCPGLPVPIVLPSSTALPVSSNITALSSNSSTSVAPQKTAASGDGHMSIQPLEISASAVTSPFLMGNETSPLAPGPGSTTHITITSTITVQPSSATVVASSSQGDDVIVTSHTTIVTTVKLTSSAPAPSTPPETSLAFNATKPINASCPHPTYTASPTANITAASSTSYANPTRCVVIVTNPLGKLVTVTTDIPGKCNPPTTTPSSDTAVQVSPSSSRPTFWVTQATGCITVSPDANNHLVTIASNPPVNGTCPPATYVAPTATATAKATATSRPTVWITQATGCITVSRAEDNKLVTIASNPPVNGTCPVPTYVAPMATTSATRSRKTVYLSPSPVSAPASSRVSQ